MPTRAPRAASARAVARPMPREAPVTSALVSGVDPHRRILSRRRASRFGRLVSISTASRRSGGPLSHDHATVAEEEYLQTMFWLEEAGLPITGRQHRPGDAALAADRARDDRPPRARRLRRPRAEDKSLDFTDDGREHAEAIVRRHRLIERFLTDVLGIPWDEVHEEAERLEHAMSPVLEERMLAAIGDAKTCPHGHPIVEGAREQGVLLADVEPGAKVTRPALRERGRGAAALPEGRRPGARASRARSSARTTTRSWSPPTTAATRSRRSVAETVSVRADPAPPPRPPLPEALVLSSDRYGR